MNDQALQLMRFQPPTFQLGQLKVRLLNRQERLVKFGTAGSFLLLRLVGRFSHDLIRFWNGFSVYESETEIYISLTKS